jgi:hypothetical protein
VHARVADATPKIVSQSVSQLRCCAALVTVLGLLAALPVSDSDGKLGLGGGGDGDGKKGVVRVGDSWCTQGTLSVT